MVGPASCGIFVALSALHDDVHEPETLAFSTVEVVDKQTRAANGVANGPHYISGRVGSDVGSALIRVVYHPHVGIVVGGSVSHPTWVGESDVGPDAYHPTTRRLESYGTAPTAVAYDDNGNVIGKGDDIYTYTPFDKLRTIDVDGAVTSFDYNAFGDRVRRENDDEVVETLGSLFEMRLSLTKASTRRRLIANGRVVGQIAQDGVPDEGQGTVEDVVTGFESLHDDHLGSTTVVAGEGGTNIRGFSYDAWGRARTSSDWLESMGDGDAADANLGFTGHVAELDGGLINMGGRMYDPKLARFTSADPVTEDPYDAQTYNRYSYVLNRPLVLTDPTGYAADFGDEDVRVVIVKVREDENVGVPGGHDVLTPFIRQAQQLMMQSYWERQSHPGFNPGFQTDFYDPNVHRAAPTYRPPSGGQAPIAAGGWGSAVSDFAKAMTNNRPDQSSEHDARRRETSAEVEHKLKNSKLSRTAAIAAGAPTLILLSAAILVSASAAAVAARGVCFGEGTLVATEDGLRPIEEVEVGDLVWARDDETGEEGWKSVVQVVVTPDKEVLELTFGAEDGTEQVLRVTADHPLWSLDDEEWDEAGHLDLGEQVHTLRGPMWLASAVALPATETVYNFEVADAHTYFVGEGGVWVHNNPRCFTVLDKAGRLRNASSGEFVSKATANTANHIFGPSAVGRHNLGGVLNAFGGNGVKATRAIQQATQGLANSGSISGVFETTVNVAGSSVTVRGAVVDGVAKIGTAFIP